jgi:hypothetical protein
MAKKITQRSFNDVLTLLGSQRFDVAPAPEGSGASKSRPSRAFRVSKNGCAAEIAEAPATPVTTDAAVSSILLVTRPGWVLNGEISHILDRGYQKFLKTAKLEIPATADHLRAIHQFAQELDVATGETELYNEALGTTSDVYLYDRVAGRPDAGH